MEFENRGNRDRPVAPTQRIQQEVAVWYRYPVVFTDDLFGSEAAELMRLLESDPDAEARRVLFVLDDGVVFHHPHLPESIVRLHAESGGRWDIAGGPLVVPGGERVKNSMAHVDEILRRINQHNLCRHSYVVAVGGGAVLDMAGYAAATAHRGVRLIRVPTTVLAQNDSGVGVKNGVNAFGKKNFIGTFAPPFAVLNDFQFLRTLSDRDWRAGTSEAVKVALIKDPNFFAELEASASAIVRRQDDAMRRLVFRCAELHLAHIREGGDAFELGSSRPLDFGHWAAHKLEQLTDYELRHGEAVAIGIALDCTYAMLDGTLPESAWRRIMELLERLGFELHHPMMSADGDEADALFAGLNEFREHLGGRLTILLIEDIGAGYEVHEVDVDRYRDAIRLLRDRAYASAGT